MPSQDFRKQEGNIYHRFAVELVELLVLQNVSHGKGP